MEINLTIELASLARDLALPEPQVRRTVELLDEGNTVPFITRYRKDQTGGLDEEQIRQVQEAVTRQRLLVDRKRTILKSIESQGKLTDALAQEIATAVSVKRLEDLYLPFKPKKQTLATAARERGLEPLAREILGAEKIAADLDRRALDFVNIDKGLRSQADVLLGVGHLIAEHFSERADLRETLRSIVRQTGKIVCAKMPAGEAEGAKADKAKDNKPTEQEPSAVEGAAGEDHVEEAAPPEDVVVTSDAADVNEPAVAEAPSADQREAQESVAAAPEETDAAPPAELPSDESADADATDADATDADATEVEAADEPPSAEEAVEEENAASDAASDATAEESAEPTAAAAPAEGKSNKPAAGEKKTQTRAERKKRKEEEKKRKQKKKEIAFK
ncbi:MAG: hypothetical protein KDA41_20180, partial [Planctomycetales bacterium]|nr:hypothetical protein [Planctomycetales bacterium]